MQNHTVRATKEGPKKSVKFPRKTVDTAIQRIYNYTMMTYLVNTTNACGAEDYLRA